MKRWLLLCAVLSGCASPVPVTTLPPTIEDGAIWIHGDEPGDRRLCVDLFEENSMWRWRCLAVKDLRGMLAGMSAAN